MLTELRNLLFEREHNPASPSMSPADCYSLLQNERRRHLITYLATVNREVSAREISEHLADIENVDRQTLYISLIQNHLPKCADYGVLTFSQRKMVQPTPECKVLHRIDKDTERHLA